jgi:hypothetical protein
MQFVFMCENGTVKPVETVLRRWEGEKGETWRGESKIYCEDNDKKKKY